MQVLFVCIRNSGRSQIAEGFFNKFSKHNKADSAGTYVSAEQMEGLPIAKSSVKAAKELGCDISKSRRTQLTRKITAKADVIIVIMTPRERKLHVPSYLKTSKKVKYWNITDMRKKSPDFILKTSNRIKQRVKEFVEEVG